MGLFILIWVVYCILYEWNRETPVKKDAEEESSHYSQERFSRMDRFAAVNRRPGYFELVRNGSRNRGRSQSLGGGLFQRSNSNPGLWKQRQQSQGFRQRSQQSQSGSQRRDSSVNRPKSDFQKTVEARMDQQDGSIKLILTKIEELAKKGTLTGFTQEEEYQVGILTNEEIVHFSTDEKSTTSAIIDDGCPSTLAV